MLTYWVKQSQGGWVITAGQDQLLGPCVDKETLIIAACDYARNQAGPMLTTRVMVRDENGAERPVATFGPKQPRARPV